MKNRFDHKQNELEGYLGLGMTEETLKLAKAMLKQRPVSASSFWQAVSAILIQADRLKPLQQRIESAYESLNRTEKKQVSIKMLHFYVSVKKWRQAADFIPRRTQNSADLLFSMWTWLELREMEKAGRVFKQCLRLLGKTNPADEFASGALTEAVAAYHAQNGEWNQAERAWRIGQCFPWFAENAWTGLVKLHAYRGLLQANVAFESARNKFCAETDSLMLPGNNSKRAASAEKEFRRYAKHLAPVIPAKERWRFGL